MSTASSSLSHDALVDTITTAVADAIRISYQSPPGLTVDDAVTKSIADSAADKASAAVRDALSKDLPSPIAVSDLPATETASVAPQDSPPILPEIAALLARLCVGLPAPTSANGTTADNTNSLPPPQVLDAEVRNVLHTQAVAVLNVKALVPLTLNLAAANHSRWHGLFLVILGKYALTDHVTSDVPLLDQADWTQMKCVVLAWLYGIISQDLLQEVMSPTASARMVWRDLEFQFLSNRELHAVNLSAEFHTL
uniref:OSJNBb0069N01.7 protein n=1 Tax=Oryza sativa subsp. japonica TaxID=39947 RepID=Q7XRG2_ORYSJ|nr:OSJNBb0069N01.7 [Oryza sativa Japonica Group]